MYRLEDVEGQQAARESELQEEIDKYVPPIAQKVWNIAPQFCLWAIRVSAGVLLMDRTSLRLLSSASLYIPKHPVDATSPGIDMNTISVQSEDPGAAITNTGTRRPHEHEEVAHAQRLGQHPGSKSVSLLPSATWCTSIFKSTDFQEIIGKHLNSCDLMIAHLIRRFHHCPFQVRGL